MHRDDPRNSTNMSVDQRLDELASLLATGFLRHKRRMGYFLSPARVGYALNCARMVLRMLSMISAGRSRLISRVLPYRPLETI